MNLAEFTTMLRYFGKSDEMHRALNQTQQVKEQKIKPDVLIASAITLYGMTMKETHDRVVEKLRPINPIITMEGVELGDENDDMEPNPLDVEFNSAYSPNQMRCLALVSHNGMKDTMLKFVMANKNVLKKFRLTGTNSTMSMLKKVFAGDDSIVFGPACKSG